MRRELIPGTIWKISCHNLCITYFTLTFSKNWLLYCKNIFELTNCENKSLRELPLFKLQIVLFRVLFKKYTFLICTMTLETVCKIYSRRWHLNENSYSSRRIYIWANYSVSSYLNFIPICWNVLIWLKYDFMHVFMHRISLYFDI
jgi:hypothetical protein